MQQMYKAYIFRTKNIGGIRVKKTCVLLCLGQKEKYVCFRLHEILK